MKTTINHLQVFLEFFPCYDAPNGSAIPANRQRKSFGYTPFGKQRVKADNEGITTIRKEAFGHMTATRTFTWQQAVDAINACKDLRVS